MFVDDLDRCDVPGAVNVAYALNMLMAAAGDKLVFVIGLDRDIVAAGITAKYSRILPYLEADWCAKPPSRAASDYGHAFLEKFIQVPFKVPRPAEGEVKDWLAKLGSSRDAVQKNDAAQFVIRIGRWLAKLGSSQDGGRETGVSEDAAQFVIRIGPENEQFREIVSKFAALFEFNPRRIKVFTNILRLRMVLAYETGVFDKGVSWEQFAFFTAITTHWPKMISDLSRDPLLLKRLYKGGEPLSDLVGYWSRKSVLMEYIRGKEDKRESEPEVNGKGSRRPVGPDEILQPGAHVRMDQTTGKSEVFEPAPGPTAPQSEPKPKGPDIRNLPVEELLTVLPRCYRAQRARDVGPGLSDLANGYRKEEPTYGYDYRQAPKAA